jgi:hypothetical protein
MYQGEMFTHTHRRWEHCGGGVISEVHTSPCGKWAVKHGRRRDGTLNYLEWCLLHQEAGTSMQGMPYIESIVHTEEGYMATMLRYYEGPNGDMSRDAANYGSAFGYDDAPYLLALVQAFCKYMNDVIDLDLEPEYLDLHDGNHMFDRDNDEWVLLDPSAGPYQTTPCTEHLDKFTLQ